MNTLDYFRCLKCFNNFVKYTSAVVIYCAFSCFCGLHVHCSPSLSLLHHLLLLSSGDGIPSGGLLECIAEHWSCWYMIFGYCHIHMICGWYSVQPRDKTSGNSVASIWFEIWRSWIRAKKFSIFPGKFLKNFWFYGQKNSIDFFSHSLQNFRFSPKIIIYSYILGKLFSFSLQETTFKHTVLPVQNRL